MIVIGLFSTLRGAGHKLYIGTVYAKAKAA